MDRTPAASRYRARRGDPPCPFFGLKGAVASVLARAQRGVHNRCRLARLITTPRATARQGRRTTLRGRFWRSRCSAQAAAVADLAWRRRSKSALGPAHAAALHPAVVEARQRGRDAALCPSRADPQDGKDVAGSSTPAPRPYESRTAGCQHSHGQRRRDRGPGRQQSQASPPGSRTSLYTIALLIKGRSGGIGTGTCTGRALPAPATTFYGSRPAPRQTCITRLAVTVSITSSVAILNHTTWSTIVETWRPGRLEL